MIVKSLELDFFRNYVHLEAVFDPRVNLIYGDNAQGKTNLLEAVAYLSTARSHRARYDREMIHAGSGWGLCQGRGALPGPGLHSGGPAEPGGPAPAVVQRGAAEDGGGAVRHFEYRAFLPGGPVSHPGGRRRPGAAFWTSAICQLRPRYEQALSRV